jgi:hypothetical protein
MPTRPLYLFHSTNHPVTNDAVLVSHVWINLLVERFLGSRGAVPVRRS